MTAPVGRRRADRAGWPRRDRWRWRRARICAFFRRSAVGIAVIVAIFLAIGAGILSIRTDHANDRQNAEERRTGAERDEARKYQACVQRKRGLRNQNALADVSRDSLLTGARRQRLQARKTDDAQLRARFVVGAHLAVMRRARIRLSPLPKCKTTYPTGYLQRFRFPDLAKQAGPPVPPTP